MGIFIAAGVPPLFAASEHEIGTDSDIQTCIFDYSKVLSNDGYYSSEPKNTNQIKTPEEATGAAPALPDLAVDRISSRVRGILNVLALESLRVC